MTVPAAFPISGLLYQACICKPSTTIALYDCSVAAKPENSMPDFKNIETAVLLTMLAAYHSYYRELHTKKGFIKCKKTMNRLQSEIEFRKKGGTDITTTDRY